MTHKKTKYRNQKVEIDGFKFDSKKEGNRYLELKFLYRTGKIKNLVLQPEFIICDSAIDPRTGRKLPKRKYIADFKYFDCEKGVTVVEDVKSAITREETTYRLKRQLFLNLYSEYKFIES